MRGILGSMTVLGNSVFVDVANLRWVIRVALKHTLTGDLLRKRFGWRIS